MLSGRVNAAARVLIVDDDHDIADMTCDLLTLEGYETIAAYDGLEAIRLARDFHPQIVVLDITMPGMGGCDVARRLRSEQFTKPLFLVAHTALTRQEDVAEIHSCGFDARLTKPVESSRLRSVLKSLLEATGP